MNYLLIWRFYIIFCEIYQIWNFFKKEGFDKHTIALFSQGYSSTYFFCLLQPCGTVGTIGMLCI